MSGVCVKMGVLLTAAFTLASCIQPKLYLPAEEVLVDMPIVITDIDVVWNLDIDWQASWHYGWDLEDISLWGEIEYPEPKSFEIRRYYLGEEPGVPHTEVDPPITVYTTNFRSSFQFGYYDLLLWSNIESEEGTQVVVIDESDLNEVTATTTVSRALNLMGEGFNAPTALFNQPEIFYSAYPQDIYISRNKEDYDYFDDENNVWVKRINSELHPLVFIYMVQIILYNNDGRVTGVNGDCALSAMASGTSVNTGHTNNNPCIVYFNARMKENLDVNGKTADIIGGKLTTYGLCDMEGYTPGSKSEYQGSRTELPNFLYFDIKMSGGSIKTLKYEVTEQCQRQCHGGVITVEVDCSKLENPSEGTGGGLFVPNVDDYDELVFDIPMG